MMSRETCFLCFVQHRAGFWKCLWDYFGLSKWKPRKKVSRSYLLTRKMEKSRQKEFLTTWECLNSKKSSQEFPSCVVATRDSNLLFCKMFSRLGLKPKLERLYPRTVKRHKAAMCNGLFFFSDHCIKQIDSMLPWVCTVIDHRRR